MAEVAAFLMALGQQVWQQQGELPRDTGGQVCLVSLAPFLVGAAAVGLRSLRRSARARVLAAGE